MKKLLPYIIVFIFCSCSAQENTIPRKILFAGDSRFAVASEAVRTAYSIPGVYPESGDMLVNHFGINGRTITNWGGAGFQIGNVYGQLSSILAGGFDKIFIQCGTNDNFSGRLYPVSTWDTFLAALSGVKEVYVTEPIWFRDETAYSTWGTSLASQKGYNDSLKRLAAKYSNVKWVPVNYKMIGSNGYVKPEYTIPDGIHQTYAGYLAFFDALDEYIIY